MSTIEREKTVTVMPSVLDPRVERGAALLDEKMPGWAERVDADKLELSSTCNCVLGLLCGHYFAGLGDKGLGLSWKDGPDYGFDTYVGSHGEYALLEQDWRLAILSRRA